MIASGLAEQIDALVAHLTSEHDGENE